MIKLSIIIPVYNVEKYISQCLDSVLDQNLSEDEYEVICVNDGSTDRSRDIIVGYLPKHSNLRLIDHPFNKKLGAARNTGRAAARGKYIWNVDSDDYIASNCLRRIIDICSSFDLDVLMFNHNGINPDGAMTVPDRQFTFSESVDTGLNYLNGQTPYSLSFVCPVWNKVIRKNFLDDNVIFSPEINMGEDVPYSFRVISKANRFMLSNGVFYYYRNNTASLTGSNWRPLCDTLYERCIINSKMIFDVAYEIPEKNQHVRECMISVASFTFQYLFSFFDKMPISEQKKLKHRLRCELFNNKHIFQMLKIKKRCKYAAWLLKNC